MAKKLKDEWLTENFDDGEFTSYYEENDFTEYELFLLDKEDFINLDKIHQIDSYQ